MSPTIVEIPDDGGDNLDRSQTENVAQPAKTPSRRRGGDTRPNYKESGNGDSGSASDTEEANDGYMDFKGDIPAKKPNSAKKVASRALRPQEAKQEPMSSEQQASDRRVVIKTGKRSHGNDESEPTKPAKRGRKPTANTEIKKFEKDAFALAERFSSKMMDLETTRSENQDLQVQIKALKSELERAQQAQQQSEASFNQKITQLKNDSQKWRCDLASALEAAKKDSGKYIKVSDSEIKQNWMTLSFNIRGLVTHYLTEMPSDQITVLESQVIDYMLLTPRDISALRTNILRRAIWNILDLAIFSGNRSVWHGDIGSTLTQFLSKKNNEHMDDPQYLATISQIKFRAAADLNEKFRLNKKAMDEVVNTATMELRRFLPGPKKDRFKVEIKKLIAKTAELHSIMMKSKAIFLVQWIGEYDGKELVPFDQTKMSSLQYGDEFDASNSFVKFVEAPGLVKIGNADGEQFDTQMVLCESQVILGKHDDEDTDGEDTDEEDGDEEDTDEEDGDDET
ncbi:hypothetical protein J3E69DRAFT_376945 [Trichoderma sp. SZMC 28015]